MEEKNDVFGTTYSWTKSGNIVFDSKVFGQFQIGSPKGTLGREGTARLHGSHCSSRYTTCLLAFPPFPLLPWGECLPPTTRIWADLDWVPNSTEVIFQVTSRCPCNLLEHLRVVTFAALDDTVIWITTFSNTIETQFFISTNLEAKNFKIIAKLIEVVVSSNCTQCCCKNILF